MTKKLSALKHGEESESCSDTPDDEEETTTTTILKKKTPVTKVAGKKKEKKWNKQRVLLFCQRGISCRTRHLMLDLRTLMPHSRPDTKLDRKDKLFVINEVAEMKNCNKCVFFEMRKKKDLFMWVSNVPHGPSARFMVENVHTMDELKLAGNCLKGSRPILSFDSKFDESLQSTLLKTLFTQIFSTPPLHPKSKPFVDRVMTFSLQDHRIWIRNYQIINESDMSLTEIGPRFVLNLIRIFDGSFGGSTLYENPHYVSPNEHRRRIRQQASFRYMNKQGSKERLEERLSTRGDHQEDDFADVFHTITQADLLEAKRSVEA